MIISNKTQKPIRVPLGGDKVIHLAPRGSGSISAQAAERPAVQRMVERGEITIASETETHETESIGVARDTGGNRPARVQRKGLK